MTVHLLTGDCRDRMAELPECSVDAIVCDPPYGLVQGKKGGSGVASVNLDSPHGRARIGTGNGPGGFMGMAWDSAVPGPEFWAAALRVAKPGAHLVAFGGTRTFHRLACAIEDAGWEIRDTLGWLYGSGFPKSLDVSKAIDKVAGAEREVIGQYRARDLRACSNNRFGAADAEVVQRQVDRTAPSTAAARQWQGWGTALKPAWEPAILARKPLVGTVAANVLAHGTGALNIDGCRVGAESTRRMKAGGRNDFPHEDDAWQPRAVAVGSDLGRWPANILHDGSDEVLAVFPDGSARFFWSPKASTAERNLGMPPGRTNTHPTVKPVDLMAYLCRLVCPPGGTILDPFMGSGSTGIAALREGFGFIGIDLDPAHVEIARLRITGDAPLLAQVAT